MPEIATYSTNLAQPSTSHKFSSIGIELEYPVAGGDHDMYTATSAMNSESLYREFGRGTQWPDNHDSNAPPGMMTHDHVGAEITSGVMDLHTEQPEEWYSHAIEVAENRGYPFAASGYGDTSFGLHMHISSLTSEMAEQLFNFACQDWTRIFFCTSISRNSADPWRHGGFNRTSFTRESRENSYILPERAWDNDDGHYEFRMPEPMLPEHLSLVMEFFRRFSRDEDIRNAADYAHELVMERDERITAVQKYNYLAERYVDWPTTSDALTEDDRTDPDAARTTHEILGGDY